MKESEVKEPENWKDRWYVNTVWYQIFPDRFCNGLEANDPQLKETYDAQGNLEKILLKSWDDDRPDWLSKYGGDLAGIDRNLTWLSDLGIGALWLNPVFQATSNHKYNTSDYGKIDPEFGTRAELFSLVEHAHEKRIKVILDGVFNHTGYEFWAFQDIVAKGEESAYKDWYYINGYPVTKLWEQSKENPASYECWWGIGSLPKLNVDNPDTRNYIFDVSAGWMKGKIDGWRLDVPEEIKSETFWKEWAAHMKSINRDAYLTGEIWGDASAWLNNGDIFDGVMNYHGFRDPVLRYFSAGKIPLSRFDMELKERRALYPHSVNCAMQNLLSSHDTARILSAIKNGDEKDADKEKKDYDTGPADALTLDKYRMVVLFQMTYVGCPMVYYGDEIGMAGGKDPDCRRPMIWNESRQNREILEWYKKLIAIRNQDKALRTGTFETLHVSDKDNTYAFRRQEEGDATVVVFNYSPKKRRLLLKENSESPLTDQLTGTVHQPNEKGLQLELEPWTGMILKRTVS